MTHTTTRRTFGLLTAGVLTASLFLTGCSTDTSSVADAGTLVTSDTDMSTGGGAVGMEPAVPGDVAAVEGSAVDGGAGITFEEQARNDASMTVAAPAEKASVVAEDRAVIKSASAVVGVDDLPASRASLLSIIATENGTVTYEYVYKGGPEQPMPVPAYSAEMSSMPYPQPYYGYPEYVDVTFTVPSSNYESTIGKVRGLGEIVTLQQSKNDVTGYVVDLDARITAAEASVERVEALLGEATTLDEMLRLEQELTLRQGNLESLQSQQKSMQAQVAESTISVRLVPNKYLEQATPVIPEEPTFWDDVREAFGDAWSGFALALIITSPIWVIALIVLVVVLAVRRSRKQSREADSIDPVDKP